MKVAALLLAAALATAAAPLPEFDKLWDYDDPAATEAKFREVLPVAERSGDVAYHAELLTQIGRTCGLRGKFAEGHLLLDKVEKMLGPSMDRARVRYLLERGRMFNSAGKPDTAKPLFLGAWDLARKAGQDSLAIDAAHMVAIAVMRDPQEALRWNLDALKFAEASEDPKARKWLGSLYNNIGWTYHDMGEYLAALATFQKGVDWRTAEKQGAPLREAKWSVGRALRSLGRLDEALAVQRAVERENAEAKAPDAYVFEELGECLLAKGRKAEAEPYFKQAYAELSRDEWLVKNELARMARLRVLAGAP